MGKSSSSFINFSSLGCRKIKGVFLQSIPIVNLDDQEKSESSASSTYLLVQEIGLFFNLKNLHSLYTYIVYTVCL